MQSHSKAQNAKPRRLSQVKMRGPSGSVFKSAKVSNRLIGNRTNDRKYSEVHTTLDVPGKSNKPHVRFDFGQAEAIGSTEASEICENSAKAVNAIMSNKSIHSATSTPKKS